MTKVCPCHPACIWPEHEPESFVAQVSRQSPHKQAHSVWSSNAISRPQARPAISHDPSRGSEIDDNADSEDIAAADDLRLHVISPHGVLDFLQRRHQEGQRVFVCSGHNANQQGVFDENRTVQAASKVQAWSWADSVASHRERGEISMGQSLGLRRRKLENQLPQE